MLHSATAAWCVAFAEEMESEIELQKAGATIVADSMASITKQIASNAGTSYVQKRTLPCALSSSFSIHVCNHVFCLRVIVALRP